MRIVIANASQHHSFQTALAAAEGGLLEEFITGIYFDKRLSGIRTFDWLIRRFGTAEDLARFRARHVEGLSGNGVRTVSWPELLEQTWRRFGLTRALVPAETATYLKNEVFDRMVARSLGSCDVFHGFEQCALFSLAAAKQSGIPTILDEPVIHRSLWDRLEAEERRRCGLPEPKRPPFYHHHIARKYRELERADYLFVGLDFVRQSYEEEGYPADRIFLIPYGTNVSTETSRPEPSSRSLNILYVGQVSWVKGLHRFLDIYDSLDLPDLNLTVIGLAHPEWLEYFEERFARMKNPVTYLKTVPHDQMSQHLGRADVLVFPSLVGGVGLATYEAMAASVPVLTSHGDVVIRDGKDGMVASIDDPEAWRSGLTRLWEDPDLRLKLGNSGRKRVRKFSWSAYREGVRDSYLTVGTREGLS